MKNKGLIFVISAPSGTGKTTVINQFLLNHKKDFVVSVSVTTRQPRKGEIDGKDYYFFTKDKFKEYVKTGKFLEYAPVLDNFYGTLKETVKKSVNAGKNVIMDIDVQGAMKIKFKIRDCVTIFLLPPSFSELARRLKNRRTDTPEAVVKRLALAKKELKERVKYDYIIVNKDLNKATENLEELFESIYKLERFKRNRP
jgi:guanylate kinase